MVEDTRACLKRFYRNYQSILGNHHISEMIEYIDQFEYHPLMCYTLVNTCLEKTDKHIFTHQQIPLSITLLDKHSKEYLRASLEETKVSAFGIVRLRLTPYHFLHKRTRQKSSELRGESMRE